MQDRGVAGLSHAIRLEAEIPAAHPPVYSGSCTSGAAPSRDSSLPPVGKTPEKAVSLTPPPVGRPEDDDTVPRQPAGQARPAACTASAGTASLISLASGREPGVRVARQVEPRVDRDAVPADGDARPVDVAERLAVGCLDHLHRRRGRGRREAGELVGQARC